MAAQFILHFLYAEHIATLSCLTVDKFLFQVVGNTDIHKKMVVDV